MRRPDSPVIEYKEADLQKAVASRLNALESLGLLTWNHPPHEGKRHVAYAKKLKSHGTKAGEPDCVIYLKGGKTIFIELKTMTGTIKKHQLFRHNLLSMMGFPVHVVLAETPHQAVREVDRILKEEGVRI